MVGVASQCEGCSLTPRWKPCHTRPVAMLIRLEGKSASGSDKRPRSGRRRWCTCRLRRSCAVVGGGLGKVPSVRVVTKERVDPRERHRAPTDHGTRRHGAPQDVRAGKFPNRQETGYDRHEEAYARRPERQPPDHLGVQEAASRWASFGVLRIVCHGLLTLTSGLTVA